MIEAAIIPLKEHFSSLNDPCAQHSIEHLLFDIVLVTICAVICGADTWVEIENHGITKQEWLEPFWSCPTRYFLTIPLNGCLPDCAQNNYSNAFSTGYKQSLTSLMDN
jgi:hypothetical protein